MLKDAFILFISNFVEIVHVELSNKGGEISMPEVDRQNFLFKTVKIQDSKVGSFFIPYNNIWVAFVLHDVKVTSSIS